MSSKTSERDRLKDFSFLEKLQRAAYFALVSDDSDHGGNDERRLTVGLGVSPHRCPSSQQRLRGAGGGGRPG